MAFKTSVNIKFDIGNSNFTNRYIPTQSHTEVIKGILNGFLENSNNAHIMVGPYGTGKSLVATVISNIVTKSSTPVEIEKLVNKFKVFDDTISSQIIEANNLNTKYIPIMLSGNEGRFRKILLSNIVKTLKEEGIDVILPGVSEKIIEIIDMWKINFPNAYHKFCEILQSDNINLNEFLLNVNKQKDSDIKYFENIYRELTNGATFDIEYEENFFKQMEYILKIAHENNLGLFIIHDEFGRFLQGLKGERLNEAMQDIQDFAELANRVESLKILFITHKSLRLYFKGLSNETAKEFQRIEKRFKQYHISNDQKTFLQLAEVILKHNLKDKPQITDFNYNLTVSKLKKYSLFPSLNPEDREKIIVESLYPLHPITLYMLPDLSKIFGQNERTLFTFLESDEKAGLNGHLRESDNYYLPYKLFDYFFPNTNESDVDTEVSQYLLLYKKAFARIPVNIKDHKICVNLVKLISLWNLCGLQKEQGISTQFLAFSMQEEESYLEEILQLLQRNKVLRYNLIANSWEINTGSSIDVKAKIDSLLQVSSLNTDSIYKILNGNLPKKYYFPERYNDEKDMTRFAEVEVLLENDFFNLDFNFFKNNKADLIIYFILPNSIENIENIKESISKLEVKENVLFAIHHLSSSIVEAEIKNIKVIEELISDKTLFTEDKGIKEELSLLLEESIFIIKKYLDELSSFNENIIWFINAKEIKICNSIVLSDRLSDICDNLFKKAPRVVNDSFNRMNISSQQKKAAITLVNGIIENTNDEKFGISGNGPEYAIYAAVFKNNGNFFKVVNSFNYEEIDYEPYKLLRDDIITLLNSHPKGNFNNLIEIFSNTPYGIRRPLIPILLVAILRDRWNEFMLYRNEMFVPGLNGEKLYEILNEEGPENYQYVYEQVNERYIDFFKLIEDNFTQHKEDRLAGRSRILITSATLVNWLRSLPRITQISEHVDKRFSWLRDIIKKTEVNPQESIGKLSERFSNENIDELLFLKKYGENFIFETKKRLLKDFYSTVRVNSFNELKSWTLNLHEFIRKNNKFVKTVNSLETENFTDVLAEEYFGVPISSWSDATYDAFLKQLKIDFFEAINFESENRNDFIDLSIGDKKKIITKVEFSPKTSTVYSNIERIINQAGRNIPPKEMEYMIYLLLNKYVE
ncbi:hypothetical protein [Fictibacillus halophilus]|uniref:hypothetical protein n=1 Tax=Fictibacillus halophilus TaxID=1610490 RepID=UPI001CFAD5B1|nr:hypothetical protein [Fictibacillus halophilus]